MAGARSSDFKNRGSGRGAVVGRVKRMVNSRCEHLYKILIIGELGTGKTSIIRRYVGQTFSKHYRATIGVDFALKVLQWDANNIVRLQLWDIAGQERFGSMTRIYYTEAVAAFIVFDVNRATTFDAVLKWKADLDDKVQLSNGDPVPCVLLGNKCDLPKEGLASSPEKVSEWARQRGFVGSYETSAMENKGIDEAMNFIVRKILTHEQCGHLVGGGSDPDVVTVSSGSSTVSGGDCVC
ncbi:ras-related protein Rab-38-like isoform X1 [Amphibalanus amphitrite]|uniref:ras-related protein Rab-38-like isoform X1 n=1 Tax=Amphibalanus amphitrite TaxID=1232801 RepID=UPI001C8FA8C2|nr:ras-related protein Rab-38-like isoform X1 [Amphibalanus amphitrite]